MRISALVKRIVQQMRRDKRTLGLLFIAPLFIISLMYFLFNGSTVNPKLGTINVNNKIRSALQQNNIDIKIVSKDTKDEILETKLDGILEFNDKKYKLILENGDPSVSKALQIKIKQVISSQMLTAMSGIDFNKNYENIDTKYVYGYSKTTFFDILSPVLVGFFVFFFVFLISGIGLLRERTTGTLERLMSTPIRRYEVITGYLIGYGIFAVIQTIIIILYSVNVLNMVLVGSIWNVILINLLLALVALSLGILLSTFAASEFQMMQFIPIVVVPQVFFAGIFPLDSMAPWLRILAKIMPIYYGADALKGVMYKGWSIDKTVFDMSVLLVFALVFIVLNVFALKKYRVQ